MELLMILFACGFGLLAGVTTYKAVFGPKKERIALGIIACVGSIISLLSGII